MARRPPRRPHRATLPVGLPPDDVGKDPYYEDPSGYFDPLPPPPSDAALYESLRSYMWMGAGLLLVLGALTIAALALAIWAVVQSSNNSTELDEAIEGGLVMRSEPTRDGHTPRWDTQTKGWLPGHGRMADLEDVRLGTKQRPLEDGDLLKWMRGRIVNARDRALEQELGHHLDTHFVRLRNGDIPIYNETAAQWRNAPFSALLALETMSDVELEHSKHSRRGLPDRTLLEYNRKREKWTPRAPIARAWLRFCAPPDSDPAKSWGRVDGIRAQKWTHVKPVSPEIGIYALDLFARGGMMVSRKHVSIRTPKRDMDSRPSTGRPYVIRASVSARGLPNGAWGFLVGSEQAPQDGGFATHHVPPEDSDSTAQRQLRHWSIESVREIRGEQEIELAYRAETAPNAPILVQCLQMSVEEL